METNKKYGKYLNNTIIDIVFFVKNQKGIYNCYDFKFSLNIYIRIFYK